MSKVILISLAILGLVACASHPTPTAQRAPSGNPTSFYIAFKHPGRTSARLFSIPVDVAKGVDCYHTAASGKQDLQISILNQKDWSGDQMITLSIDGQDTVWMDVGHLKNMRLRAWSKVAGGYIYLLSEENLANPAAFFQATDDAFRGSAADAMAPGFFESEDKLNAAMKVPNSLNCAHGAWGW